ncbi:MAG: DUF3137 domain-containing protein [Bacteroidia bacterium]
MALLDIFRPHKKLIWKQFAARFDADFIPGKGLRRSDTIRAYHENWEIYFSVEKRGKRRFTRIRAPFVNRDSFRFAVRREHILSGLGKVMGMQDVIVGHSAFDKSYVVQGNDERKLKDFFDNELIRHLLRFQHSGSLEIRLDDSWSHDPFSEGVSELLFEIPEVITNLQQMEDAYNLFAEVLDHLCVIGSAYKDPV